MKIDIIKHAKEIDGKSTASHAAILAPEDVHIFTYPCIPDYSPNENVILIYPHKDAYSVDDAIKMFLKRFVLWVLVCYGPISQNNKTFYNLHIGCRCYYLVVL